ncbi:MAG: hypothetical protein J6333_02945, partial [Planctomycetes bacterium]|nr:hypothetical protein [Planctomycetota bacterium]
MIEVFCPECQARYRIPDERQGIKFRCKKCQKAIVYTDPKRRNSLPPSSHSVVYTASSFEPEPPAKHAAPKAAPAATAPKPAPKPTGGKDRKVVSGLTSNIFRSGDAHFDTVMMDALDDELFDFSDTQILRLKRDEADDALRKKAEEALARKKAEEEAKKKEEEAAIFDEFKDLLETGKDAQESSTLIAPSPLAGEKKRVPAVKVTKPAPAKAEAPKPAAPKAEKKPEKEPELALDLEEPEPAPAPAAAKAEAAPKQAEAPQPAAPKAEKKPEKEPELALDLEEPEPAPAPAAA